MWDRKTAEVVLCSKMATSENLLASKTYTANIVVVYGLQTVSLTNRRTFEHHFCGTEFTGMKDARVR